MMRAFCYVYVVPSWCIIRNIFVTLQRLTLQTKKTMDKDNKHASAVSRKRVEVVAAVIIRDGRVFATQRGYGAWRGWWEFPGGKIEQGETPEQALRREISEELATEIAVGQHLTTVEYDYPDFHLTMHCYLCAVLSGRLTLLEHEASCWLSREALHSVTWLPADIAVLPMLAERLA